MITRLLLPAGFVVAAGLVAPAGMVRAARAAPGSVVRVEHRDPSTAPARGPTTALVTIELFFSPKIGNKLLIYRALEKLQAAHPARIRLVYRVLKRGTLQQLSIAVLEAHAQGKFDALLAELQKTTTTQVPTKDQILELARKVGMDSARLSAAITEGRYTEVFEANDHRLERLAHAGAEPNALFNCKAPAASMGTPNDNDLEREYAAAYDRSLELLDRGVPANKLLHAFEQQALRSVQPYVVSTGSSEDEDPVPAEQTDHRLAQPPLELSGLPTFGNPKSLAAIPVVVLCRPNDIACYNLMRVVRKFPELYANAVQIVWAPWFDVSRDDAAELTMLGDATLCAEQVGSSPDELNASPGWRWMTKQLEQTSRAHGRRIAAEKLIDLVTADTEIDSQRLSACRARMATTTLDWIAAARKAGVTRSPALVIGGRIYENLNDSTLIHQLIEAELAPGTLARCATTGCAAE